MLCLHYIDSNICHRNIIEKTFWQGDIASLLTTDTGDAGSSPHVARRFYQ